MAKKSELPLLNSERKELNEKITQLKKEKDALYAAVLRKINGIVVRCDALTEEQKTILLSQIWRDET